ncbi:F-box only protein 15 isoform X2 [Nematostella vectensis]|uniref:F-box only protein 15 isoform X2 n=1 Tax=Nematostella vectensis TaxID=45351 RepID=UPI00138FF6EA|nr:F-box only protein 15 isoform X2 [Nematostella vectensis]
MASKQRHQKHLSTYLKSKKESPDKRTKSTPSKSQKNPQATFRSNQRSTLSKAKGGQDCMFERLPDELLLGIFKFLSPSELLKCAQVCRHWSQLTTESCLWENIFLKVPLGVRQLFSFEETKEEGFNWKKEVIKRCITARNNMVLKPRKEQRPRVYQGKPGLQGHLAFLSVKWKLCFMDTNGNDHWVSVGRMLYHRHSVSVHWGSVTLPPLQRLKNLRVYAFVPVFYNKEWVPHKNSATTRSLILQYDMKLKENIVEQKSALTDDDLVTLHNLPNGTTIGCWKASWKGGGEIAFVTVNLPHHKLARRILLGSSSQVCRIAPHVPVLDDIDPRYGLHGYTAELMLRTENMTFLEHHFRDLRDGYVTGDEVIFTSFNNEVCRLHGETLWLPWKTELFKGTLKDSCILDLVFKDEHKKNMWSVSSLVCAKKNSQPDVDYSREGEKYIVEYRDDHGAVFIYYTWDDDRHCIMVDRTQIHINKAFLNMWFGTSY